MGGALGDYKYLHNKSLENNENFFDYDDEKIDHKYLEKKKSIVHPDAREMLHEGVVSVHTAKILQDVLNPIPNDIYWERICTAMGDEKPAYKLPGMPEIPTYTQIWDNILGKWMQYILDKEKNEKKVFTTYLIDETDSLETKEKKILNLQSRVISELRLILSKYKKYERKSGEKGPIDNFTSLRSMFPKYLYAGKSGKRLKEIPYFSSALGKLLSKLKSINEPYVDPNATLINEQVSSPSPELTIRQDEKKYATPYVQQVSKKIAHIINDNNGIFPERVNPEKTDESISNINTTNLSDEDKRLNDDDIERVYSKDDEGNEPWHNRI